MQCLEGALIAAAALRVYGHRPLLMDLRANDYDYDHVVALFRIDGHWGAISKTKYPVLRYREPIYKNVRELAMSYFHEYFLNDGTKTLRSYSDPFDLDKHYRGLWMFSRKAIPHISGLLDRFPHYNLLKNRMIRNLRKADEIEIRAAKVR